MYQTPDMYKKVQPGRKMIKVTGILMIIFGAIGLIVTLASMEALSWYDELVAATAFEAIAAAIMLAFGIAGVSMSGKPGKGSVIIAFGIVILALKVADLVWGISIINSFGYYIDSSYESSLYTSAIAGLVLPILYIVGGAKKRRPLV
jgi:hypothetical protein